MKKTFHVTEGEKDLRSTHERMVAHLENTPLGVIEWNSNLQPTVWSKRAEDIFGWSREEVIENHTTAYQLVHPDDLPWVSLLIQQLLTGIEKKNTIQCRVATKNKQVIWCEWYNSVSKNENGNVSTISSFVQNITARKATEAVLQDCTDRYELLSKATNDAIWDWDIEHDLVVWNHGIQTLFGYPEGNVQSWKTWVKDKVHPEDYSRVSTEIADIFAKKLTNWNSHYQYLCADGVYKHVQDRAYVIYNAAGNPERMIGAMQDITRQKGYMEEIERLSLVASKTTTAVAITDPEDKIEWVNQAFINLTGFTLSEVQGKKQESFLQGPETDLFTVQQIGAKLKQHKDILEEIVNYSKTGRKYWARLSVTPVFDDHQKIKHFISIQTDITAQKDFERNITAIARELSGLIENANTPIFGMDRNGYINEWNKVTAELTGYSKNEVLGKKLLNNVVKETHRETSRIVLDHAFREQPVRNLEIPMITKDNRELIILLNATARRNSAGEIIGILMVGQDITELIEYRKNLENKVQERTLKLNEALSKEKELVELKSKFISIASHEFRTPLSTISLIAGILRKHKEKLSTHEFNTKLDTLEKQVGHMTYLLDDIATMGRVDADRIKIHLNAITIADFFEQAVSDVQQSTSTHKIKLKITSSEKIIKSDEKLLKNIVNNLLTNAIKFSPTSASVSINIMCTPEALTLEVKDSGIGIAKEDLPSVFTSFYRGSNVGTIQGTGLGLSIVKKAVTLLRGDIQIHTKSGQGTKISVTLPL